MYDHDLVLAFSRVVRARTFDEHGSVISVNGDLDLATAPQLHVTVARQIAVGTGTS